MKTYMLILLNINDFFIKTLCQLYRVNISVIKNQFYIHILYMKRNYFVVRTILLVYLGI